MANYDCCTPVQYIYHFSSFGPYVFLFIFYFFEGGGEGPPRTKDKIFKA